VLSGETGAARVRRIVNKDSSSAGSDLAAKMIQINAPALIWQEVIVHKLNTQILANWLTKRETGFGYKYVITDFAHDRHRAVECARTTKGEEHIVRINWMLWGTKLLSDSLASRWAASRLGVAIVCLTLNYVNYCFVDYVREFKSVRS